MTSLQVSESWTAESCLDEGNSTHKLGEALLELLLRVAALRLFDLPGRKFDMLPGLMLFRP